MYSNCNLCVRGCGRDRSRGERGFCGMSDKPTVAYAALHKWEEPPISGTNGSGAIFFSGCSLNCIYCQNYKISRGQVGKELTESELAELMISLEVRGAHNINFVTPTHFAPSVISSVNEARGRGLKIPTVYNTSSCESPEVIEALSDTVNIWLPDLKYYRADTALSYSSLGGLPTLAFSNIEKMVRLSGAPTFSPDGLMKSGTVVRILLLPSHVAEAKLNLKRLYSAFGEDVYISLMSQYTPVNCLPPPLNRRVSSSEYSELVDYAVSLGVKNAFIQEGTSASESFIPDFDAGFNKI